MGLSKKLNTKVGVIYLQCEAGKIQEAGVFLGNFRTKSSVKWNTHTYMRVGVTLTRAQRFWHYPAAGCTSNTIRSCAGCFDAAVLHTLTQRARSMVGHAVGCRRA